MPLQQRARKRSQAVAPDAPMASISDLEFSKRHKLSTDIAKAIDLGGFLQSKRWLHFARHFVEPVHWQVCVLKSKNTRKKPNSSKSRNSILAFEPC